jgi:uncharacterized protein with ParB-like and HNH nuclease domain/predicted transport protein
MALLESQPQKVVPIFQRSYSWSERNCRRLWQDLVSVTEDPDRTHFMGAVVDILDAAGATGLSKVRIIDGQQRVISIALMLLAIGTAANGRPEHNHLRLKALAEKHLLLGGRDGLEKYKLLLTEHDRDTLLALVDERGLPSTPSAKIVQNFNYFVRQVSECDVNLDVLYQGLWRLTLVEITLKQGEDNPQLIFESLNSTGEALKQSDLIRNFLLMDESAESQVAIYERHWFPMEIAFGQEGLDKYFDEFMRAYLSLRLGRLVNKDDVYEEFKKFANSAAAPSSTEALVQEISRYAGYFLQVVLRRPSTPSLKTALEGLAELSVQKAPRPLLLRLWDEYSSGRMPEADLIRVLEVLQSFILRRAVCDLKANSLDILFVELSKHVAATDQLQTVCADLLAETKSARFPNDQEFLASLYERDIYNFRQRDYLLRRLENSAHPNEPLANLAGLTVEHVLPQNENLSDEWKRELGLEWQTTRDKYLHTVGNLTLTGYNSLYSDRPFAEKRDMENGFATSVLFLNRSIASQHTWGEDQIVQRAFTLGDIAVRTWPVPQVAASAIAAARERGAEPDGDREPPVATSAFFEDMPPQLTEIYNTLEEALGGFGPDVDRLVYSTRVTFKAYKIFAQVNKRRGRDDQRLLLFVDLGMDEIDDPFGICEYKTGVGHHGVLNMQVTISSRDQLPFAIDLARRSYDRNSVETEASDQD